MDTIITSPITLVFRNVQQNSHSRIFTGSILNFFETKNENKKKDKLK